MTDTVQDTRARVLCCPVTPHPDAMEALEKYAPQAELVDVTGDNYGYWNAIRARWTGEQDLILIEQDIEIGPDTIESMENCAQDWCCYAYPIFRSKVRLRVGLGCTKISAAAQRKVTASQIEAGFQYCASCKGKGCWWHLDGRIASMLKKGGFFPHVHGDVIHHHDYETGMVEGSDGKPIEWFFEEDSSNEAALAINPDLLTPLSYGPAKSPREATQAANELIEIMDKLAEDPSLMKSIGAMAPYPLGLLSPFPIGNPFDAATAYDTDKVAQGYLPTYNHIADQLGQKARVCEVGVLGGGSLATWLDLFQHGTVVGVDISPQARWPDDAIRIVAGQDDPELPDLLRRALGGAGCVPEFDLIVDDASHDGTLTAKALELLWPLVSPGGFYVIEDWFVGFSDYHGACKSPEMLNLAQSLLERLRWDTDTESVSYRYGMAILRKKT